MKKKISITIDDAALRAIDSAIDNIYIRNRSQAIEYFIKNALGDSKTAVVLAGGAESNLRVSSNEYRITSRIKKNAVIELALRKLRQHGFREVFLVARHPILTAVFSLIKDGTAYGMKVNYVEEKESGGTAATLRLLKGKVKSDFLVVYEHIVFERVNLDELWNHHMRYGAIATLMLTTAARPSEKGTVKMEGSKILEFVQKPKKSDIYLVFSPIFVAEPELLDYGGDSLEYDVFPELAERGLLRGHMSSEKELHIHRKKDLNKVRA